MIDFLNKLNSFLKILLLEIGANGIRAIIMDIVVNSKINKMEIRNTRFWLFGTDF